VKTCAAAFVLASLGCGDGRVAATAQHHEVAGGASASIILPPAPSASVGGAGSVAMPDEVVASDPIMIGSTQAGRAGGSAGVPALAPMSHPNRVPLVDHADWKLLDSADDPFADRPPEVQCDPTGAASELLGGEDSFGVDTGTCGYATVRQPSRDYVAEGETLRIRLWHFTLTAPAPAEGHAVVQLDDTTLLDEHVAIPATGALIKREIKAPRAFPAGVPVLFHIHNHGDNSWALVEVSTGL
jgi:hypothetical protein